MTEDRGMPPGPNPALKRLEFFVGTTPTFGLAVGATTIAIDANRVRSAAAVRDVATDNLKVYLDGRQDGSVADASIGTWVIDDGQVGHIENNLTHAWAGKRFVDYVFGRALSAGEIASLHADPWQLFEWDSFATMLAAVPAGFSLDLALPLPFEAWHSLATASLSAIVGCGRAMTSPTFVTPTPVDPAMTLDTSGAGGAPAGPQTPLKPVFCGRGLTPAGYDIVDPGPPPVAPPDPEPEPDPVPLPCLCDTWMAQPGATVDGGAPRLFMTVPSGEFPIQHGGGPSNSHWTFMGTAVGEPEDTPENNVFFHLRCGCP